MYTRKVYTDVSYIACAKKLLAVPEAIYPQFATHNAQTLSAIYHIAGQNYYPGQYEFQCLHGMGEPLYEQVVGKISEGKLNRPCRVYAPVGTHETLLAYLVRRLLENGANTSFVNRIADHSISIHQLVADPVSQIEQMATAEGGFGLPHPRIPLPRDLYGSERANSSGIDMANEHRLASLSCALLASAHNDWKAAPMLGCPSSNEVAAAVLNPSDLRDIVGYVQEATIEDADNAIQCALSTAPIWQATPPAERAAILERAADLMEAEIQPLMGLLAREAGKTFANAIAEVREAVDFLRYYAVQARNDLTNDAHRPLGPVVCISPWNFPLAIFSGQVAAALAAGNPVLAKPAEQTPLVAAQAVRILLEAGIPEGVLQLLPGRGETVGARLVGDDRVKGVMFTGSTEVARLLQRNVAGRLDAQGRPIPLIAETGGQNAMIVDSTALTEQVVNDVLASAFDSAGQRCSALRILCLQEDIADRTLVMLKGAMATLRIGNPDRLATDIGPVISHEAQQRLLDHIRAMAGKGLAIESLPLSPETAEGTFVAPTIIELRELNDLPGEVFGPILHVYRFRRDRMEQLIDDINALGYGLTFGLHTRVDDTVAEVTSRIEAGNIYVNRNVIGAVVGVQPFGGHGLSGTGPKAGGPLYLRRLLRQAPLQPMDVTSLGMPAASIYADWLEQHGQAAEAELARAYADASPVGGDLDLPGPVGETNDYRLDPRGRILLLPETATGLALQLAAVLATGNSAVVVAPANLTATLGALPAEVASQVSTAASIDTATDIAAALVEGSAEPVRGVAVQLAERDGPIVTILSATAAGLLDGSQAYDLSLLVNEVSISINTAAAGGNASLMAIS